MSKIENANYKEVSAGAGTIWKDRKHWLWFPFSFTRYSVGNGRIYQSSGLFSSREDECLLYRVTDISLTRSLGQKLCGTGSIRMNTKDRTTPIIVFQNIKNPVEVKRMLSDLIEEERSKYNVVGKEMYGAFSHMDPDEDEQR